MILDQYSARNMLNKSHGHMIAAQNHYSSDEHQDTCDSGERIHYSPTSIHKYVKDAKFVNVSSNSLVENVVQRLQQADTDTQTYHESGSPDIQAEMRNIGVYKF